MNREVKSASSIASSTTKSLPKFAMRDNPDSGSGTSFDDDCTSQVADPLGLCPHGVKSTRIGKAITSQLKEDNSAALVGELVRAQDE